MKPEELDELEMGYMPVKDNIWIPTFLKDRIYNAFPALLALARDGVRYRWAKDNLFIGYVFQDDVSSISDLDIDASINAMKERK